MLKKIFGLVVLAALMAGAGWGAVPMRINFQGKIPEDKMSAFEGGKTVVCTFKIGTAYTGTCNLTTKDAPAAGEIYVDRYGVFNASIGEKNSVPSQYELSAVDWTQDNLLLNVALGAPISIGADQPLNSTPYAFTALNVFGGKGYFTGNVGIMTSAAPAYPLDVNGQVRIKYGTPAVGHVLTATNADGLAEWKPAGGGLAFPLVGDPTTGAQGAYIGWNNMVLPDGTRYYGETDFINSHGLGPDNGGGFAFMDMASTAGAQKNTLMYINRKGNVGIGTAMPNDVLEVGGVSPAIRLSLKSEPLNYYGKIFLTPDGSGDKNKTFIGFQVHSWPDTAAPVTSLVLTGAGKVGIGTSTPSSIYSLDVVGAVNSSGGFYENGVKLVTGGGGGGSSTANALGPAVTTPWGFTMTDSEHSEVFFKRSWTDPSGDYTYLGTVGAGQNGGAIVMPQKADLLVGRGLPDGTGLLVEHMRVAQDGKVGIGTADPQEKLEVKGGGILSDSTITGQSFTASTTSSAPFLDLTKSQYSYNALILGQLYAKRIYADDVTQWTAVGAWSNPIKANVSGAAANQGIPAIYGIGSAGNYAARFDGDVWNRGRLEITEGFSAGATGAPKRDFVIGGTDAGTGLAIDWNTAYGLASGWGETDFINYSASGAGGYNFYTRKTSGDFPFKWNPTDTNTTPDYSTFLMAATTNGVCLGNPDSPIKVKTVTNGTRGSDSTICDLSDVSPTNVYSITGVYKHGIYTYPLDASKIYYVPGEKKVKTSQTFAPGDSVCLMVVYN